MNSTLLDEDVTKPLAQGTRTHPPLCVLWRRAADVQTSGVQTLEDSVDRLLKVTD